MNTIQHAILVGVLALVVAASAWGGEASRNEPLHGALSSQLPQVEETRRGGVPDDMEGCMPVIIGEADPVTGVFFCP